MMTQNDKILIIVVTRLHTGKGSSNDEYKLYWAPTKEKPNDYATDIFFWRPALTSTSSFLLIHGHHELETQLLSKKITYFHLKQPHKYDAKQLQNIFQQKSGHINLKPTNWRQILFFVHGNKEVRDKIREKNFLKNIPIIDYTSANTQTAPQHLLERLYEKLSGDDQKQKDEIIKEVQCLLNGLLYKKHLLGKVQELLLRIRLNVEFFLDHNIKNKNDLEEARKALQHILFKMPTERTDLLMRGELQTTLELPPLQLNEHHHTITEFFEKKVKNELWLSLKQLLNWEQGFHQFLSQQQFLSQESLSENDFINIMSKLTEAACCVALLKEFYTEEARKAYA